MTLSPSLPPTYTASFEPAAQRGTYMCALCQFPLSVEAGEPMPECPNCGDTRFRTASMFAPGAFSDRTDLTEDHEWLAEARADVAPGSRPRLTYRDNEMVHVVALREPVTRIGRSPTAHVLIDDPTVSRRHALIALEGETITIVDDRSLNGVYVNGERVEQATLADGDEIVIGAVHLHLIVP